MAISGPCCSQSFLEQVCPCLTIQKLAFGYASTTDSNRWNM